MSKNEVRFFRALSSEPRINILILLKEHPQCVKAIAQRLHMSQPTVSQHLRVLREAGLVKARKIGYWVHYDVDMQALDACGKSLTKIFGGWISSPPAGKGTANCPPGLLKECRAVKSGRKAHGRGKRG